MGPTIQWIESYVTDDKIYCVYLAQDAEQVRQHASKGGFPVNRVSEVRSIIDPTTAYRSDDRTPLTMRAGSRRTRARAPGTVPPRRRR